MIELWHSICAHKFRLWTQIFNRSFPGARGHCRQHPLEFKRALVALSLEPGASVARIARERRRPAQCLCAGPSAGSGAAVIGLPAGTKVGLAAGATDMRSAFNGLAVKVQTALAISVLAEGAAGDAAVIAIAKRLGMHHVRAVSRKRIESALGGAQLAKVRIDAGAAESLPANDLNQDAGRN